MRAWNVLKNRAWGQQIQALSQRGWVEPVPDYNAIETNLGKRLYVLEHGFGRLAKVQQKKAEFGVAFVAWEGDIATAFDDMLPEKTVEAQDEQHIPLDISTAVLQAFPCASFAYDDASGEVHRFLLADLSVRCPDDSR